MSSGHATRSRREPSRCEATSSAPRWMSGVPGPRIEASVSASILSWKLWRLSIQARSSFGCIANTRTVRACDGAAASAVSASAASAAAAASSPLLHAVDPLRKLEVILGQAALGVRREGQLDLVPGDRDVGVVVHLLRRRRDPVHEVDRALEVVELELAPDRVARALPAGEAGEPCLNVVVAQKCHRCDRAYREPSPIRHRDAVRPRPG